MLLDDFPSQVYPLVGNEECQGCGSGLARKGRGEAGRLAVPWLSIEADGYPEQLLVSHVVRLCKL